MFYVKLLSGWAILVVLMTFCWARFMPPSGADEPPAEEARRARADHPPDEPR